MLGLGLGLSSDRSGIGEEKLDPGPVQHSMAGCGAHARSRRFLRVPCGELPVSPEVPFSRPVAPRLVTFTNPEGIVALHRHTLAEDGLELVLLRVGRKAAQSIAHAHL